MSLTIGRVYESVAAALRAEAARYRATPVSLWADGTPMALGERLAASYALDQMAEKFAVEHAPEPTGSEEDQ